MEPEKKEKKKDKKKGSGLRLFGKILLGIFIFLLLLILFVRSPWGQGIIVDRLVSYLEDQTGTEIKVDRLFITFSGNINLEGLYMEDKQGDTLIYSRYLEADIPLLPIIKKQGFSIDNLDWRGVRANIRRVDSVSGFNYQFLMDAFVSQDTTVAATPADTTGAGMEFSLGDIQLSDFQLKFNDQVGGIDSQFNLGELEVEVENFDLAAMDFDIREATLLDTRFSYVQTKPFPEKEEKDPAPLPKIAIHNLKLDNVSGEYNSIPDGLLADVSIDDLIVELPEANLSENEIILERLRLKNSNILIHTTTSSEVSIAEEKIPSEKPIFEWPQWDVIAEEITLVDNHFQYIVDSATPQKGVFNPNAIDIQNLTFQANHLALKPGSAEAFVQKLNFREASGLDLTRLAFDLDVSEESMSLNNLNLQLNENVVRGDLGIEYSGLNNFLNEPETGRVDLQLPEFKVNLEELFFFQPQLRENEYVNALSEKSLYGSLYADGKLSEIKVQNSRINWGQNTSVALNGNIFNATEPDKIGFDFPQFRAVSTRNDLLKFVKEEDLGIKLPENVEITGNLSGTPENIQTDANLSSSMGDLQIAGKFVSAPGIAFDADVQVTEFKVGELLQNKSLGNVSLDLKASGNGANVNELDVDFQSNISSFGYNNYTFKNLDLSGELENGEGYVEADYKDENLNMTLEGFIEMDSIAPKIAVQLDVIGANLQELGLFQRPVNAALKLEANFKGNATNYDVSANITDGIAVYDNESYLLGNLEVTGHVEEDTTSLDIRNRILNLRLRSNASPIDFSKALNRHYESYFSTIERTDTVQNPVNLDLTAEVSPTPMLEEVFLPKLEGLDTIKVKVDFREKERSLIADIDLPYIKYFGSEIDSLRFNLDSNKEGLAFDFGLKSLDFGPLAIKQTILKGELADQNLELDFTSNYEDKKLMHIRSQISKSEEILRIHVVPDEFVLNAVPWNIAPENEILIGKNNWEFNDFRLTRNGQEMIVSNQVPGVQKEHIGLEFENFNLATLFSYLNPEEVLASGRLNGNFIVEEPFGSTGMLANLRINEFAVMEVPFGILTLEGEAVGSRTYDFDLAIKEGDVDLDLTGNYQADETAAKLNLDLDLNEVKMKVVEGLSSGALNTTSGSFSGNISVKGTTADPVYEGTLNFNQAAFTVATLNAPFVLADETLKVTNEGLFMDNFEIRDSKKNTLVLDGGIYTESLTNPEFDLDFTAKNFTALNSTEEDNELFYGIAVFDAEGSVTGNLELPKIDLDLDIKEETDMTYVIPSARLEIEEREGVVKFVNREDPDRILTQTTASEDAITFSGLNLNSYINLEKNATFTIVLDEDTGDHFRASGEGDLLFNIYPNGRTTLSGRVDINDGYYEMSLYNLVTRKFDLMDGSSIVWAGDPLDADLDITAVYRVEVSASGLMAPQITGADVDVKDRYRQELPFLVYLNIDGDISQPLLSFGLDMPEDEQGAIGGQVYGRVQQINTQENELNKQVFSLLVLNRFFPDSGSDGSAGGTLAFARDNLNEALSDQLNLFSDKLLGETGIDLKFGLDSYTDYQGESPQERTQLDITAQKSLLDDRLIVSVGSEVDLQGSSQVEESSPVIGNVSLEYLLTENGRFRLRAFRRKSYENVIDGQIIVSGLSLIFTQEFNKFHEIWDQVIKDEKKKKKQKEEEESGE